MGSRERFCISYYTAELFIESSFLSFMSVVIHSFDHAMQDNEPLMRALSKLIYVNSPDLVLFVGEALVGNDAVDQLSKFNQVDMIDSLLFVLPTHFSSFMLTKFHDFLAETS